MRILIFCHSLRSDWNHGNAHFLRGVVSELDARGHDVVVYEPRENWSCDNLVKDAGKDALEGFRSYYPELKNKLYDLESLDLQAELEGADLVLVHEWNDRHLVARIGQIRKEGASFHLLFHDTHHRAVSAPEEMAAFDLSGYDGVLAFGNVIRDLYLEKSWAKQAWTWHEAADTRVFKPMEADQEGDLVWVGNWGDEERTAELFEFLIRPSADLRLKTLIHGVRYPQHAQQALREAGITYGGYLPNYCAPETFARYRVTVHVPRRPYVEALPGIPTIRPFEAMACGIPLVSAPWNDAEGLFRPGTDYLIANNGEEMKQRLRDVLHDAALRQSLISHGLETIRDKHTCAHRTDELLEIYAQL
jgi:spore maturation protein CgeB